MVFNGINLMDQRYSPLLENVEDPPAGGGVSPDKSGLIPLYQGGNRDFLHQKL